MSLLLFVSTSASWAGDAADVKMSLLATGAERRARTFTSHELKLVPSRPAELKAAPALASPYFGWIEFAGKRFLVVIDAPAEKDAILYVDANGNGDLTDDPLPKWAKAKSKRPVKYVDYGGVIELPLAYAGATTRVTLRIAWGAPHDHDGGTRAYYYADYAMDGAITLNGTSYHAMLLDDEANGSFTGPPRPDLLRQMRSERLLIDVNGNGKFEPHGEMFEPDKPFNIRGTTWALADRKPDGSFKVVKSDQTVAEILPPPELSVGKTIPSFTATDWNGLAIHFPDDYKGKIVMLDFWATWCVPCMHEMPTLVKAYNQYHPKGLEVLGISLDDGRATPTAKVREIAIKNGMTWPQVCEGKLFQSAIAQQFGIDSIPAALLVDGTTGKILALGTSLRGEKLEATLKSAP